jgi:Short-chain dehydrogenases of various substrate specificities
MARPQLPSPRRSAAAAISAGLDVTSAGETAAVFDRAFEAFGGLDILAANAGISTMNPVADLTEAEWDANMDVNAKGIFLSNQAAVRRWLKSGSPGVIVNTASLAGKIGAPLLAHYSASKFAVVGFTQALAREVGKQSIRVNCVCPGFVRTGMQEREIAWEGKLRGMTPEAVRAGICRAHAAGAHRGARRCGRHRAVPGERSVAVPHRRGGQRQRRRADGLM